ncbi:MAG: AraC family transcriptional regulator [Paenibacillus sp.]|nr:AraC family transcriptional regulator [Paenibacillus sp.]
MLPESRLEPVLVSQVYWKQKKAFQLAEDIYGEWVLFAVTEGRFRYGIADKEGEAVFGDLIICPPHTLFKREIIDPLSFHFYRFDWNETQNPTALLPVKVSLSDHIRLSSTYYYLERLSAQPADENKQSRIGHLLKDLWQTACMEAEWNQAKPYSHSGSDTAIEAAAHKLRQQAFGKVELKQLSTELGLSPVQFTRRFQAVYGQPPMDYLTSLRLQKAQALLLETELTLEQIAEQCGYDNGFYFSRMFTKKMNVSPSAYRKSHRI